MDRGRILLALTATGLGLLALEGGFRLLESRLGVDHARIERLRDWARTGGEAADYEPRAHILYARPRGAPGVNDLGFSDDTHPRERRPDVPRVACLGSSTTEGGNPEGRAGSYPHFLGEILERSTGGPVEVLNFGMSGWTSAETLVNYVLTVQDFAPDVVVIHESVNDVEPRNWPGFHADYSHYRRPWRELHRSLPYRLLLRASDLAAALELRRNRDFGLQAVVVREPRGPYAFANGRFPPGTAEPFRRNLRSIVELVSLHGGRTLLVTMPFDQERARDLPAYRTGILEHNAILRELAGARGAALVDLEALAARDAARLHANFLDLVHLTPEGNRWKAEHIAEAVLPLLASGRRPAGRAPGPG